MDLKNKTALVPGGAFGLGLATVNHLEQTRGRDGLQTMREGNGVASRTINERL